MMSHRRISTHNLGYDEGDVYEGERGGNREFAHCRRVLYKKGTTEIRD